MPHQDLDLPLCRRYRGQVIAAGASPQFSQSLTSNRSGASAHSPTGILPNAAHQDENTSHYAQPPLGEYYNALFAHFGPQRWWPGKTPFEIIVGAILTQNTSWTNVEKAISNLRAANLLSPAAIDRISLKKLERLVRPSGYFRKKARKLKAFCKFLRTEYSGSLKRMFATHTPELRKKLLGVFGIGPETADSILLYAGGHAVFVVDTYTKRILARHGWHGENADYEDVRRTFEMQFPGDARRFNEFHALIVSTGKQFCLKREPLCDACPLGRYREEGR